MLLAGSVWFVVRERGLSNELGRLQAEHQLEQRERRDLQTRLESLSAQAQALQTELDSERRLRETVYQLVVSGFDRGQQPERVGAYMVQVTTP